MAWSLVDSWDASNEASGSTLVVTTDSTIPAGSWVAGVFACDNSGSSLPTIVLAASMGYAGTLAEAVIQGTASASAGASVRGHVFVVQTPAEVASGATFTYTLGAAVTAKAAVVAAFAPPASTSIYTDARDTSSAASSSGTRTTTTTPYGSANVPIGTLVLALGIEESSWTNITPPNGYSEVHKESGANGLASVCVFLAYSELGAAETPAPAYSQGLTNAAGIGAAYLLWPLTPAIMPFQALTAAGIQSGQRWP